MTPIPRPELVTLVVAFTDAEDLAAEGNAADGYTALLAGLHRAREAEEDGEEWGAALVSRWREACELFAEWHGIGRA
jgi:hypothetical protein